MIHFTSYFDEVEYLIKKENINFLKTRLKSIDQKIMKVPIYTISIKEYDVEIPITQSTFLRIREFLIK